MALSKLSLCNRACAIIGADPLDTLDADTPGAQIVALRYDSILEFMIGIETFTFSTSTRQLSQRNDVTILNGWQYCHALPGDRIGPPVRIAPTAQWPRVFFTDWLLEGNNTFSNDADLYALIRVLPDPAAMTGTFRRTFETAMAGEFAMGLASDKALRAQLLNDAFGSPEMNGTGGMMASAIQENRKNNPSSGVGGGTDPLTSSHASTGSGWQNYSFP